MKSNSINGWNSGTCRHRQWTWRWMRWWVWGTHRGQIITGEGNCEGSQKKKNYHKSLASHVRLGNRAWGERREMDSGTAGQLSLEPTPTQHPTLEKVSNTRTVARSCLAMRPLHLNLTLRRSPFLVYPYSSGECLPWAREHGGQGSVGDWLRELAEFPEQDSRKWAAALGEREVGQWHVKSGAWATAQL